jgi:hypothetical protein
LCCPEFLLGGCVRRLAAIGAPGSSPPTPGGSFAELLGPLMGMIALPYQGAAAAAKEIERPQPVRPVRPRATGKDPLRELDMRLTYRTVRVLLAIGQVPGASNREVAEAAGVEDQGQISKLLARLKTLGLIENAGAGRRAELVAPHREGCAGRGSNRDSDHEVTPTQQSLRPLRDNACQCGSPWRLCCGLHWP